MDWLILTLLVLFVIVPTVLLFGFAGCKSFGTAPSPSVNAPSDLAANAHGPRLVKLSWKDNSGGTVKFSISRGESGSPLSVIASGLAGRSFDDKFEDLPPSTATEGRTFIYSVKATLAGYPGSDSLPIETSTTTFPAGPTNLVATPIEDGQINLNWTNNSGRTNDFQVKRTALEEAGSPVATFKVTNDTRFSDTSGLTAGQKYQYEVTAEIHGFSNAVQQLVFSEPAIITQRTWKTVYNVALTQNDGTDRQNDSLVQRIDATRLVGGTNGTKLRITLRGATNAPLGIDKATVSHAASAGNPWDSDSVPTQLFKAKTPLIDIPVNLSVTLDPADFTLQPGKDLIIAFDIGPVGTAMRRAAGIAGCTFFSKNNADAASLIVRPGPYAAQANTVFLVEKIEVVPAL